jgi:hypothetical protein
MKDSDIGTFNIYFHEEKGQYVCRKAIPSRKALDNREIRTTLTKDKTKYRIHLVDLTANRRKLLATGTVSSIGELVQAANAFLDIYMKLG